MAVSAIARKIAESKARGGGSFVNPGQGELVVMALKDGDKPEFHAGATFVAELKVLACEGYKGILNEKKVEKPAGNPVGSSVSFLQQFDENPDVAYTNAKTFLLALMDETDESLNAAAAEKLKANPALTGSNGSWNGDDEFATAYDAMVNRKTNPARGMRIRYSTYEKDSKAGKALTLPKWESVKQTMEEIAAMRAQLDKGGGTAGGAPSAPAAAAK